jgi:PKD repeat protein
VLLGFLSGSTIARYVYLACWTSILGGNEAVRDDRGEDCRRGAYRNAFVAAVLAAFLLSSLGTASLTIPGGSSSQVGHVILDSNTTAADQSIIDSSVPSTSFALSILRGWNFITVPVMNSDYRAGNIGLKTGDVVSQWNTLTQKFDKTYIVGRSPPTLDFPIAPSTGYLVFAGGNEVLNLTGIVPPAPVARSTVVPSPTGGWEALGFLGLNATRRASEVPGMFSGGKVLTVAVFNASSGAHVSYIVGVPFTDFVIPLGLGVWCFCTSNGTFSYVPSIHPVASFTASIDHMNVDLDASGSHDPDGRVVSYEWSFGDGGTAQGVTTTHAYVAPGTYNITLTVTDETGMAGSKTSPVQIIDTKPTAAFTYVPNGFVVDFDASGSWDDYGIVSYTWDWGDGTSLTTASPIASHDYSAGTSSAANAGSKTTTNMNSEEAPPMPYVVFGFVTDPYGNPVFGASVTVTDVNTGSVWTTTTDFEYGYYGVDLYWGNLPLIIDYWMAYDVVKVTAEYDGMVGWNEGVLMSPGNEAFLWLDISIGAPSHLVTLTVTDSIGQTASVSHFVPVPQMAAPIANFTIAASQFLVTVNGSGSFDPDGSIVSYAWDFGDGSTATGVTASHSYATLGTWWITLTVTDDDGLTASFESQVTINWGPPGPPDSYWYMVYGMVKDSLGNPVPDALVRVTCLETGALWYLTTDFDYGFFSLDLGTNWTGWNIYDTIRVEAMKGDLHGSNQGIIFGPGNEAYLWLDVVAYPA